MVFYLSENSAGAPDLECQRPRGGSLGVEAPGSCEDMWSVKPHLAPGLNPQHPSPLLSGLNTYFTPSSVCQQWGLLANLSPSLKWCLSSLIFLRLEEGSADLRKRMSRLEEELDQEKKKYTMLEIKLRNSERAREDAEKRNQLLQREMEEFFSTLGSLTVGAKGARALK